MSVVVLGAINLDVVSWTSALPKRGETLIATRSARFPGGKGANQAIAAARDGASVAMIGAVGDDEAGGVLRRALTDAGVGDAGVRTVPGMASAHGFITVDDAGDNMIVVAPGANFALTQADVRRDLFAGARVALCQLESPLDAVAAFLDAARAAGCVRIVNAAPAMLEGAPLLTKADYVVVNESELAAFARVTAPESLDAAVAPAQALIAHDAQTVIATLGPLGAVAVSRAGVTRVAGLSVRAVDPTGAGDCFCGVLAASLAGGVTLADAMARANAAAALSVTREGAIPSLPARAEIDAMLPR